MPPVLVRHGLVRWQYTNDESGLEGTRVAFRGMTVDMPEEEIERLKPFGAVIDADSELDRGGNMLPLPNTASDEELIAWVSVANKSDIAAEIAARPHLGDRILAAADTVKQRLEAQNELLGGLSETVEEGLELAAQREQAEAEAAEGSAAVITDAEDDAEEDDAEEDDGEEEPDDLEDIVSGNVRSISAYLADYPEQASAIMEAENAKAEDDGREVREGVIKAVEAAAKHAAQ